METLASAKVVANLDKMPMSEKSRGPSTRIVIQPSSIWTVGSMMGLAKEAGIMADVSVGVTVTEKKD